MDIHPHPSPQPAPPQGRAVPARGTRGRSRGPAKAGADDAVLLLMDGPASFDGRYFGPTERRHIIGKAHPIWLG